MYNVICKITKEDKVTTYTIYLESNSNLEKDCISYFQKHPQEGTFICVLSNTQEPEYEAEECEDCKEQCEADGVDYEANFTTDGETWFCGHCGKVC